MFWRLRQRMVKEQLAARDIHDERVLAVMNRIPRELFVPPEMQDRAYSDSPVQIGAGQTISQPYIVALMTQLLRLKGREQVLEIGTGSGYQTVVLAELCAHVYTVERMPELSHQATEVLRGLGIANVSLSVGDGTQGWAEHAPYDRIIVTAAAPSIPNSLIEQLLEGGVLVIPVGDRFQQDLKVIVKTESELKIRSGGGVVFVPLIGQEGWSNG
ncbi:MAG: protein-L-isoaspartate(D-aspartate) O-methyltransferase [bacterium]